MKPGERINILRILAGFTQEKLAELAGINRASLVSWEQGNYNPSAPAAELLGKVLLCQPGYFLFGNPTPQSAVWELNPPKNNKYISAYLQDIEALFPVFCAENNITFCAYYSADNGRLLFLGKPDSPLNFLMFLNPFFQERFSLITKSLETKVIKGFKDYPPISLGFLELENVDSLSQYFRFAQSAELSIDTDSINTSLIKAKKIRGLKSVDDTKSLIKNTFFHFLIVLQEFENPESGPLTGFNSMDLNLINGLFVIFERLYEEIEEKSLAWGGVLDNDLADMIRRFLKGQGFVKKERAANKDNN